MQSKDNTTILPEFVCVFLNMNKSRAFHMKDNLASSKLWLNCELQNKVPAIAAQLAQ